MEMPSWKSVAGHVAAAFTALLFLITGVYKALDPYHFAQMLEQLMQPVGWAKQFLPWSMGMTILLTIAELMAAVLVLIPRFRRWGAMHASALLVVFMLYMGVNYKELAGADCSCFPILKRAVGPGFFVGDSAMLAVAVLAGLWAKPAKPVLRSFAVIAGAIVVFVAASYGVAYGEHNGVTAPDSVIVNGQPMDLTNGRFFIFFYDPECSHCNAAAKHMGTLKWKSDMKLIAVPVRQARWAEAFLKDNDFKAMTSLDLDKLKKAFPFGDPPYGVVIANGRQIGSVPHYEEGGEPDLTLRQLGAIE
jgi:uncharacterized membrane protein YphA (DoxX/SURF4 family)